MRDCTDVTAFARLLATAVGLSGAESFGATDWRRVIEMAARTRTLPILGWAVRLGLIEPPEWAKTMATFALDHQARLNVELLRELEALATCFQAAGVGPVLVRKGVQTHRLYPHVGMRPFYDIDLVADRSSGSALAEAFDRAGYAEVAASRGERARYMVATDGFLPRHKRLDLGPVGERGISVDVMRCVLPPQFGAQALDDLLRAETGDEIAPGCFALSPPHALLDSCTSLFFTSVTSHYLRRGRHQRLNLYLDTALLLRMVPDACTWFRGFTDSPSVRDAVAFAMGSTRRLFPEAVEAAWADEVEARGGDSLLDSVAQLEAPNPIRWSVPFEQRIFDEPVLPPDLPESTPIYGSAT